MRPNSEPKHLLRQAIATHIQKTAEELLYWIEELDKFPTAAAATGRAASPPAAADRKIVPWVARHGVARARRKLAR
jgi:hypothetical protein